MRLRAGDLAIARGPAPYTCADALGTPPQALILPGGQCAYPDGRLLNGSMDLGVRAWGDRLDGSTVVLIGTYLLQGEISNRLLDALPPLLSLTSDVWQCPLTPLLTEEIVRDEPGQEVVLDRMLDLLVIAALRAWFSRPEAATPAWYSALADPVVGRVLRLVQDHPAHPWTVASLAAKAGVSRAAMARRFTDLVGEPPMTYLPAGASPSLPTDCTTPMTRSARSPARSATAARSPCPAPSNACTESARRSTGRGPPEEAGTRRQGRGRGRPGVGPQETGRAGREGTERCRVRRGRGKCGGAGQDRTESRKTQQRAQQDAVAQRGSARDGEDQQGAAGASRKVFRLSAA